jgi:iron complex transport system permease protein
VIGLVGAGLALSLLAIVSVFVGSRDLTVSQVVSALWPSAQGWDAAVIGGMRLPRTGFGLAAGAALGAAGALVQGLTRNPLADPGILGISAGASFGVVIATGFLGVGSLYGYIWFAFAGALAAMALVYLLGGSGRGGATPAKLAIAGAAVSAVLFSMVSAVVISDVRALERYRFWVVGALTGHGRETLADILPFLIAGGLLAVSVGRALNNLALGEDVARSLGQRIGLVRLRGVGAVTLLAGGATAVCGPIAFLGLIVPHAARLIAGADQRWVLAYSAVLGPILLLGADIIGRVIARPDEVQAGIIVAALGAPFFVALVRRQRLAEL